MKLLTHNILTSRCIKNVITGYPLKIIAEETNTVEVEFNQQFIEKLIPKIDWKVFTDTAKDFGVELPPEPSQTSPEFFKKVHHGLLEIDIVKGFLVCPETGRKFPIKKSIPNMLCREDEASI